MERTDGRRSWYRRTVGAITGALLGLAWILAGAGPAAAQTLELEVNDSDDDADADSCDVGDDGPCSLRAALKEADAPDADVRITIDVDDTIEVASDLPGIALDDQDLTIRGDGADGTVISGDESHRLLNVSGGNLAVEDLALEDAVDTGPDDGGPAVLVDSGNLEATSVTFSDNVTPGQHRGGAVSVEDGDATFRDSTFEDNSVQQDEGGGAIALQGGDLTVQASSFNGNEVTNDDGGAINVEGSDPTIDIVDSTFIGNSAGDNGGAIAGDDGAEVIIDGGSLLDGNSADEGGGIYAEGDAVVTITGASQLADNTAQETQGGAIRLEHPGTGALVRVEDGSRLTGNTAETSGGAIAFFDGDGDPEGGRIEVEDSSIVDNDAGAIGGGLRVSGAEDTEVSLIRSLVAGNTAEGNGGGGAGNAGGLYVSEAQLDVQASTLSGNSGVEGAAIWAGGPVTIHSSTIVDNESTDDGPVLLGDDTDIELHDSVVASESTTLCGEGVTSAEFISLGHNLVTGQECDFDGDGGDIEVDRGDAGLEGLADNGGPTETHALTDDSPAVQAGSGTGWCDEPDQRGFGRPVGGHCDIGAFEFAAEAPTDPTPGEISGNVTDAATGQPVDAEVALYQDGEAVENTSTDAGDYRFEDVDDGSWVVSVQATGYLPVEEQVSLSDGDGAELDLALARDSSAWQRLCDDADRGVFDDVDDDGTHGPAVDCAASWQLTLGVGDDRFAPDRTVTRAQTASLLVRVIGLVDGGLPEYEGPAFDDIVGSEHEEAISILAGAGIIEGRTEAEFDGEASVSREQTASLLARTYAHVVDEPLPERTDGVSFDDVTGTTHASAVDAVAAAGLTTGVTADRFDPHGTTRRDQAATFVMRLLGRLAEEGHFDD